jgi:hypothetical protein
LKKKFFIEKMIRKKVQILREPVADPEGKSRSPAR